MPSCTNNSIINGLIAASSESIDGKRLSFKQNTSIKWDSSISAGDVIRYDVDETTFKKSIANPQLADGSLDFSLAEVIGVVESISQNTSGITYATIVIHGLINHPTINSYISSSAGGDGGTDVFFLHPGISGGITATIEEGNGYIAKPVLQVCPTSDGSYNSIVVNYLGYETSEASFMTVAAGEGSVGDIKVVDINADVPVGWINATESSYLLVSEYPEAYAKYSTSFGSKETLTLNSDYSTVSSLLNKYIAPVNSTIRNPIYSKVIEIDTVNNTIIVEHTDPGAILWNSGIEYYNVQNSKTKIRVSSGEITHFKSPLLSTNFEVSSSNNNQIYDFRTKTLLRVKKDNRVSYIPNSATFNNIEITGSLSTPQITNIDTKIINLENRIATLEARLGI